MKLIIVDGNNWFRRKAETSLSGNPVRECFYDLERLSEGNIVVCTWDGEYALSARRDIYPEYKAKRNKPTEGFFDIQNFFRDILYFSSIIQIRLKGYEADDVIAALVNHYRYQIPVFIESNDADLGQLNVPTSRPTPYPEKPEYLALYKTFVGDPSDNIPGCKGFGKGSWAKLTDENKNLISQTFLSGHGLSDEEVKLRLEPFFPKSSLNWYMDPTNRKILHDFYKIVNFIPIEWGKIEEGMKRGCSRVDLAEDVMKAALI